jgi:hypothetical protein
MIKYYFLIPIALVLSVSCKTRLKTNQPETTQPEQAAKIEAISDDSLFNLVQYRTFQYFWDGAEPVSGMARERFHADNIYPENDKNIVTLGGSGFGVMAILVGIERGYITRQQGFDRMKQIIAFLQKADRFHGAWPHWLNGETGRVKPFGANDNGADLVETSYMIQGLIAVKQYFLNGNDEEKKLASDIDKLWREVEWNWFTQGKNVIYWHWSPNKGWIMNFPVEGYNECLIMYVMAASSPTYPVKAEAYHQGWARGGKIVSDKEKYGYKLYFHHNGAEEYGGPLFWEHYSYLGLDPRGLSDKYANYWEHNKNLTLINRQWCAINPKNYPGYDSACWGLTASYSINGYNAHAPGEETDLGVISPTAALSSFPYTPQYSMDAMKSFYYKLGEKLLGEYGFYDAFSVKDNWYPKRYLAIDQGPIVAMMENYRTGLLWKLFMADRDVQRGLQKLGFKVDEKAKETIEEEKTALK